LRQRAAKTKLRPDGAASGKLKLSAQASHHAGAHGSFGV
jgi:hypothetical protein